MHAEGSLPVHWRHELSRRFGCSQGPLEEFYRTILQRRPRQVLCKSGVVHSRIGCLRDQSTSHTLVPQLLAIFLLRSRPTPSHQHAR